ncbi:MAG TPA: MotA/TolQ/ExbB proton channel family protein [Candidatus Binatia bacterium]|nr:MotA/TolQ/ExbB proton channel family protein [Candidatus Binatia bacterium]
MEGAATATGVAANINLMDLIQQGWYATYPLILFSVVMTSIVIERLWSMRGLSSGIQNFTEDVCEHLRKGDLSAASKLIESRKTRAPAARIYLGLLPLIRKGDIEEILEYGERRRLDEGRLLKRGVWILGTIGASAPFIGLFGTVIGIIKSFHQMAVMGTGGFAVVAAGISEALIATALGLIVAIIAVIFFNFMQVKIMNLDTLLRVGLGKVLEAADLGGVHGAQ